LDLRKYLEQLGYKKQELLVCPQISIL